MLTLFNLQGAFIGLGVCADRASESEYIDAFPILVALFVGLLFYHIKKASVNTLFAI